MRRSAGELVADRLERAHGGRPDLVELDHVKAEIAADRVADRADLHPEQRVLERRVARRHPTEIAALRFRAGAADTSAASFAKSSPLRSALGDRRRFRARRLLVTLVDRDQDVARVPLLGRLKPIALLVVGLAQRFVADVDRRRDVGERELDVFEIDRFRRLITSLVALIMGRDRSLVDRARGRESIDREQPVADLAALIVELDVAAEFGAA